MPSLLLTAAPPAPILPVNRRTQVAPPSWAPQRVAREAGMKELAVGDEQDARYAARQAGIEQAYAALPSPGTSAYWQALEGTQGAEALPPEVLVRCYRERLAAGAHQDAARIYALVLALVQHPTQFWARKIAAKVPAHARHDLEERLEEDCYSELWRVMADPDQAFILVNFRHMLTCIQEHVAHDVMEHEGYWKRRGVGTPKRVPRKLTDRLERPLHDADDPDVVALPVADVSAEEAYEHVALAVDMEALLAALAPEERALVHDLFWRGRTQDEIADDLGVTDRTVRNRQTRILAKLRRLLLGEEDHPHGD